jgi:hypothetical protein
LRYKNEYNLTDELHQEGALGLTHPNLEQIESCGGDALARNRQK